MTNIREILRVSLPLVASTASFTVMTFTDRMFLSWYGPDAIAASVPASILSFTAICFFLGTGQYVNVLIAQFYGAAKNDDVARSFWQGIYFTLASALIIILLIPVGNFVLDNSGHSSQVIIQEKAYFEILMWGGGLVVLVGVLSSYFSGRSVTKIVMYLSSAGAAINILLNYLLIFGNMGLPELGIRGAGIATVSANAIVAVFYIILIYFGRDRLLIPVHRLFHFNGKIFSKLIRFGAPNGFQFFIDIASFSVFIFLIGLQGDHVLAASNIVLSIDMFAFMPMVGIGSATSILVGQYMGRKEMETVISITHDTMKLVAVYGVGLGLMFFFMPEFFMQFFQSEDLLTSDKITAAAIPLFKILPVFLMADSVAIIFGSALAGTGDTKFKMWFSVFLACLFFVPGQILILKVFLLPAVIGWAWSTVYLWVMGIVFWIRFRSGKWRKIEVIS